ncbi:AmmeMemoRadiSam system protein A [Enorma phocaeensis]|uniref:AmmeMemoRadiSam system protein A n=1 Tax=Enorma phocaeensis TaxID=1871019 RepID=A0A921IY16_9ACTN|nr:AmmeMemoRadiSam system protein A [Enorma phocaeensis]HJG38115.1 AmmeMemoRadiSam system protein A [Enorma phocaeensis]
MPIVAAFAVPHPPLIIPAVGGDRVSEIQATVDAYAEVGRRIAALDPDTLVISSPHTAMYLDYLHIAPGSGARGNFARFGAPEVGYTATYDEPFVDELACVASAEELPAGTLGERERDLDWGVLVPLHFVARGYGLVDDRGVPQGTSEDRGGAQGRYVRLPCRVVRLGIAGLSPAIHYRLGQLVQQVAAKLGRRVVYIASGDLSHKLTADGPYGYAPEGPAFDQLVCKAFEQGDFLSLLAADPALCERAAECGLRSFQIMAGALDRTEVAPELLSYEGPFGVGYGIACFIPQGTESACSERALDERYAAWHEEHLAATRAAEHPLVRIARYSLESFVRDGVRINGGHDLPADLLGNLPDEIACGKQGAFVSLKKDGQLRGCIGTILPTRESLVEEVCANAVSAGCRDPRFDPVTTAELPELIYDVDVLSAPEPIMGPSELDPARYGVIVSAPGGRRGLLLPNLDGIDTVAEQLRIAARKGGIDLNEPGVSLERFTVTRYL